MSLYNMLFGVNALAPVLLTALGTDGAAVPRFRDCFLDTEEDTPRICIHTRTGGGNRDYYESEQSCRDNYPEYFEGTDEPPSGPWNEDLRKLTGFIADSDSEYDATYANFYYSVPPEWKKIIMAMADAGPETERPELRWPKLLDEMARDAKTPEAERALSFGKQILKKITDAEAGHVR